MIQINRTNIPKVLFENQEEWTAYIVNLIKQYGGYKNIPKKEKEDAVNKYRHQEIKDAVINITRGKCVFCESYIEAIDYTNIEHFYPKSVYPKLTFQWSNLFPACRKCNIPKTDRDTKKEPIVHPVLDNGEDYFSYKDLKIEVHPSAPDPNKAKNTIDFCKLDRLTLVRQHSEILISFYDVELGLKEIMEEYNDLVQNAGKLKRVWKIWESMDNLKNQIKPKEPHAGFLRYVVKHSEVIKDAVNVIMKHRNDLNIKAYKLY